MGEQNPHSVLLSLRKNPISKVLDSAYYPVDPSSSWKVASAYDITDDVDIEIIHPRVEAASPVARWKWAHWDDTYEVFFEFTGGRPPYRGSLLVAPNGAYLGATGTARSQVFNFVADPDFLGMYTLDMPDDFGLIRWAPTEAQRGLSHRFVFRLEDMAGRVVDYPFTVTVDTPAAPKFRHVNSVIGNNANAGTKALPFQTWQHIYSLPDAGDYIYVFDGGLYTINDGTPGNNAFVSATKPRSFICRNGAKFDMSTGHFTGSPTDVFFDNVEFDGGRGTDANVRICSWNSRFDRLFYQRCKARNTPLGTQTSQDNPTIIFTPDNASWANHSNYFGLRNFDMDSSCKVGALILFSIEHVIVRKCNFNQINFDGHVPLAKPPIAIPIAMKDSCTNAEISYCNISGFTNNSFINWMNQSPENSHKQRTRFCKLDYTGNTMFAPISYNAQASAVGSRGTDQRVERCSIRSGSQPVFVLYGGAGGEPVKISGIIYSTTGAFLTDPAQATLVDATNVQISDNQFDNNMNMISALKSANLGIRGGQMATTLVS